MKNLSARIISGVAIALTAVALTGCGGLLDGQDVESGISGSSSGPGGSAGPEGPAPVLPVGAVVGVNSFESLYTNMKVITGLGNECDGTYEAQKSALPTSNNIATLGSAPQGAILKIAACVCDQSIIQNTANGQTTLTPGVNYQTPGNQLAAADIDAIATGLSNAAWGAGNQSVPPNSKQMLMSIVQDLIGLDANAGQAAATSRAAFGACTAALSSLQTNIL